MKIFALSAIEVFYARAFPRQELHSIVLLDAVTVLVNFIQVIALVLIAYHARPNIPGGDVHDLPGVELSVLAVFLPFLLHALPAVCGSVWRTVARRRARSTGAPAW
jgi:hypothetical protein